MCVCVRVYVACPQTRSTYHSEAKHVGLRRDIAAQGLGRHVRTRTHNPLGDHGGRRLRGRRSGQPKVGNLRHTVLVQ